MNENIDYSEYWNPIYNFSSKVPENKVAVKPIRKDAVYQCSFCLRMFYLTKPKFCPTCGLVSE